MLKRHYKIQGDTLVPADDPVGIRVTDAQVTVSHDSVHYKITDYESDMAIYKPRADVIVRTNYSSADTCELRVTPPGGTAQLWFSRSGAVPEQPEMEIPDLDATRHMFGWENRALNPRRSHALDIDDEPPANAPLFNNLFFNAYRRTFAQGGFPATALTTASRINISRTTGSNTSTREFVLGHEDIKAHVYLFDGRNPDRKRFWCRHSIPSVKLDTLVVSPSLNQAYVIWRGVWDYEQYRADYYRQLEISVGGIN